MRTRESLVAATAAALAAIGSTTTAFGDNVAIAERFEVGQIEPPDVGRIGHAGALEAADRLTILPIEIDVAQYIAGTVGAVHNRKIGGHNHDLYTPSTPPGKVPCATVCDDGSGQFTN